jgi:CheY-like chemotaxis protein
VVRAAIKTALTVFGCRVTDTGRGAEALKLLYAGPRPCLIFLDPGLPQGSALLFRTFQLADASLATVPVAILSLRERCPDMARELRVSHWLVKPPDVEEMVRLAAAYCGGDGQAEYQPHESES